MLRDDETKHSLIILSFCICLFILLLSLAEVSVSYVGCQAGELYLSALLAPKAFLPQIKALKFVPRVRPCDVEIFLVGLRNLKPKGRGKPLNKPWIEVDAGDKADKAKVFRSKSSDTPSKFNPNYFESVKLRVDIPEELCLVPKLSFTAVDTMLMREYNVGACSISLLPYLPWLTSQQRDQVKTGNVDAFALTGLSSMEPKHLEQRAAHVAVKIEEDEESSFDESKPLLSG
jgi:hypothetical protein